MNVLVACEFSGIVREAFKAEGHNAFSCDLLPTEIPGQHIQDDVLKYLHYPWDLLIAFPDCTYLTNAGVRYLHEHANNPKFDKAKIFGQARRIEMVRAAWFFNCFKVDHIKKICIENPIPHGYAKKLIGNYSQLIQLWQFGHGETKAICFWLKELPKLKPTDIVGGRKPIVHYESPGPDRWKNRSRTRPGIARAMAIQWGRTPPPLQTHAPGAVEAASPDDRQCLSDTSESLGGSHV